MSLGRILAIALCALTLGGLAACGGMVPNGAISRHLAARYVGALNHETPIATVIRDRNLRPPDPDASTSLLDQLRDDLAKSDEDGRLAGITYDLTRGNRLASDWIMQSPTRWGHRARDLPFYPLDCTNCERDVRLPLCSTDADCPGGGTCHEIWPAIGGLSTVTRRVCFGHSDEIIVRVHDLVASARERVDINLLAPVTNTRLLGALQAALHDLAKKGRPISVRILVGQYPTEDIDAPDFLKALTDDLSDVPESGLSVSVAGMRSCMVDERCDAFSWNHSKIVTVDGKRALVGGNNLWSADYLVNQPVHDISMEVSGPAAKSAAHFADRLWQYVCGHLNRGKALGVASWSGGQTTAACIEPQPLPDDARPSKRSGPPGVSILAVGRLGAGVTRSFDDQSGLARDLMMATARHTIRIVQQDLGFGIGRADILFPDSTFDRLIDFIERRHGDVYIVLSNDGAVGNSGSTYSNDVTLAQFAVHLRDMVQGRVYAHDSQARYQARPDPDPTNKLLCEHVHLAPLRFGPDAEWPGDHWLGGHPIGNHSKFWMVDERAFYIGSDNMYPVNLQEYGYIVEDHRAAEDLLGAYWDPLWQWSSKAAVSGPGVKNCIFREVPNR
jgi:phosphatidylserine/phosphatidylglycerophosphate/cardiolipin synthase-like enzyme